MTPIKCPHCRVGLKVDEQKIPEGVTSFKCPKCKHEIQVSLLSELHAERQSADVGDTVTALARPAKTGGGKLVVVANEQTPSQTFTLHEGLFIIGRKASASNANICIDTQDKAMSRNHLRIEVKKNRQGGMTHTLSDNNSKNRTLYNGRTLEESEVVVLKDNDEIQAGNTIIRFQE